jgi:hypothetical protein
MLTLVFTLHFGATYVITDLPLPWIQTHQIFVERPEFLDLIFLKHTCLSIHQL